MANGPPLLTRGLMAEAIRRQPGLRRLLGAGPRGIGLFNPSGGVMSEIGQAPQLGTLGDPPSPIERFQLVNPIQDTTPHPTGFPAQKPEFDFPSPPIEPVGGEPITQDMTTGDFMDPKEKREGLANDVMSGLTKALQGRLSPEAWRQLQDLMDHGINLNRNNFKQAFKLSSLGTRREEDLSIEERDQLDNLADEEFSNVLEQFVRNSPKARKALAAELGDHPNLEEEIEDLLQEARGGDSDATAMLEAAIDDSFEGGTERLIDESISSILDRFKTRRGDT